MKTINIEDVFEKWQQELREKIQASEDPLEVQMLQHKIACIEAIK